MGLIGKLDYRIKEFVEDWREGQSNILAILLSELGVSGESFGIEKEIEGLGERLNYLECVDAVGMCEDRCNLLIVINEDYLVERHENRLRQWRYERELQELEYRASRGVI